MLKMLNAALLGVALLSVGVAEAGTIVLKNGDRITGDIKAIYDGDVAVEPEYSDEFTIDQDQIAYIDSNKRFELEYRGEDMVERSAVFRGINEEGQQLAEIDGAEVTISIMDIGEMDEEEEFFDWSVNGDLNAEINKGNTESTELGVTTDWYLKYGKQQHFFDTLYANQEQDDPDTGESITTQDRQRYQYNLNYDLGAPWFSGAFASYETDDIKGLEYRYRAIPTMGYKFWDNAGKLLNFQFGIGYEAVETRDENGITDDEDGVIAFMAIKYEYDFRDPDLTIYVSNTTSKAAYGRENLVSQITAGAKYEINDLLYFNVDTFVDYESDPVDGADNEDVRILVGLGVEFDK